MGILKRIDRQEDLFLASWRAERFGVEGRQGAEGLVDFAHFYFGASSFTLLVFRSERWTRGEKRTRRRGEMIWLEWKGEMKMMEKVFAIFH